MTQIYKRQIIRSHRASLSMKMLSNSTLVVKVPMFLPQFMIDSFITQNRDWIEKQINKIDQKKTPERNFKDGGKFLFLGRNLTLKFGDYPSIKAHGDYLLLPKFQAFRAEKEINNWYIKQAQDLITKQVIYYANQMNVKYTEIRFSDTKSKWGSCTHDNRLQFSWRLIMAPIFTINYVVVHELVHTIEKNHSRRFWSKVRLYNPSYKQQIKWLNAHGEGMLD